MAEQVTVQDVLQQLSLEPEPEPTLKKFPGLKSKEEILKEDWDAWLKEHLIRIASLEEQEKWLQKKIEELRKSAEPLCRVLTDERKPKTKNTWQFSKGGIIIESTFRQSAPSIKKESVLGIVRLVLERIPKAAEFLDISWSGLKAALRTGHIKDQEVEDSILPGKSSYSIKIECAPEVKKEIGSER